MKATFKLFTLAVAVAALASCSNDDFDRATFSADKAELTGTLGFVKPTTRIGMMEAGGYGSEQIVWTKGDRARVFTLENLKFHSYELVGGENTQVGTFSTNNGADGSQILGGKKYAVTDAAMVYSLSADEQERPLLTMTIPSDYAVDETLMGESIYNFPAPFWGAVNDETKNDDGTYNLQVTFMPLIAYLRVDLANLPVGTKAIVLTTHGGESHPSQYATGGGEGFQLFAPNDPTSPFNPATATLDQWMAAYRYGGNWVTGGASEPLSGTLNAVLSDEDFVTDWTDPAYDPATWPALGFDERLVSRDTLRIDLAKIQAIKDEYGHYDTKNGDQIFWVPIVAQYYKDLHVIAVTQDTPLSYQWVGKELKCWSDQTFTVNDIWDLSMATLDLEKYKDYFANPNAPTTKELSEVLWLEGQELELEGLGRQLIVDVPTITVDGPLYIDREIEDNNIILNLNKVNGRGILDIIEAKGSYKVNHGISSMEWEKSSNTAPAPSKRKLTINNVANNGVEYLTIVAPTSKVELAGDEFGMVMVRAANDKYVSGHALVPGTNRLQDAQDAALIVKTSVNTLFYGNYDYTNQDIASTFTNFNTEIQSYAQTANVGDVYIYGANEEASIPLFMISPSTESSKELAIRLTDVLVGTMNFSQNQNCKRMIYTTGSTAIKQIIANMAGTDDANNLLIQSYWTGAALTDQALELGFDQEQIYTAAQLASAGEKTQAKYQVNRYVEGIWLGGATYPWIGAQVTVDNFEFDGNNKSLRNMTLETNNTSFVDPHHCCTSCGPVRKLKLDQNLGLFRSIENTTSALIKKVNLNDVKLITDAHIDNIGSIAGFVDTKKLDLDANRIGEVKMDVNGYNIGGMIGLAEVAGKVTMTNNTVGGSVNNSGYIISDLANVGGQIGLLDADGDVTITGSTVNFNDKALGTIQGGGESMAEYNQRQDVVDYIPTDLQDVANVPLSYVGGIAGLIMAGSTDDGGLVTINKSKVTVANEIQGRGSYVGGIAGAIEAKDAVTIGEAYQEVDPTSTTRPAAIKENVDGVDQNTMSNEVTAKIVKSEEGSFAAGGVGFLQSKDVVAANLNKIDVEEIRTLGDGLQGSFAAGLIGYLDAAGTNKKSQAAGNQIEVDKIRAYGKNAAGLIGLSKAPGGLYAFKNDVTGETYRADEGYVGGFIATVQKGDTYIGSDYGYKDNAGKIHDWSNEINIENLKGAMAVGGIVGDNQDDLIVYAGNDYDYITVDPIAFKTTKDKAWYNQDNNHRLYAGTMANVLGYLQQPLKITNKKLTVSEISDQMKKKDMLYQEHIDEQHTQETDLKYWGDKNYYVGWGNSGNYELNGSNLWADQDYNWYKKY